MGRKDLHDVTPHPESAAMEIEIVPLILDLHQLPQQLVPAILLPLVEEDVHRLVGFRGADAVDAGNGGDDDDITPGKEAAGGGMAHLVDLVVDGRILLDKGIGGGEVGFRLVVIVVGDEILHGIVGKQLLELAVQLGRQGLVGGDDKGRPVHRGNDMGHGEGLAGPGHAEKHLVPVPAKDTLGKLGYGARLIAPRLERTDKFKGIHKYAGMVVHPVLVR